jgi:hypothetical protein
VSASGPLDLESRVTETEGKLWNPLWRQDVTDRVQKLFWVQTSLCSCLSGVVRTVTDLSRGEEWQSVRHRARQSQTGWGGLQLLTNPSNEVQGWIGLLQSSPQKLALSQAQSFL